MKLFAIPLGMSRRVREFEAELARTEAYRLSQVELQERSKRGKELSLRFLLRDMRDTVNDFPHAFPHDKRIDANLTDYDYRRFRPARHRPGLIKVARLRDGVAIQYTTREFLVDAANSLSLPDSDKIEPKLHVAFVNEDCQVVTGPNLDLIGIKAFAADDIVVRALHFGAGALEVEARTGWQHAISSPSDLGINA